jgi:predicted nucleic acid-binding protein
LIARYHSRDNHHDDAIDYLRKIESGQAGVTRLYTSDYVIDEVITTIFARTGSFESTKKYGQTLVESKAIERLTVDEETFNQSWEFFKKMTEIGLSFTDSTSAVLMKRKEINTIFAFDEHFKKIGLNVVP